MDANLHRKKKEGLFAEVSLALSNDHPLVKWRFFAFKHCLTTTHCSNSEIALVDVQ